MAYPVQSFDENYVLPMSAGMAIVGEYRQFDDEDDISPEMVKLVQEVVSEMQNRSFPAIFYCMVGEILKFGDSYAAMALMKRVVMAMDGDIDHQVQTCPVCGGPIKASFDDADPEDALNIGSLYFVCEKHDADHYCAEYVIRKNGAVEYIDQDVLI